MGIILRAVAFIYNHSATKREALHTSLREKPEKKAGREEGDRDDGVVSREQEYVYETTEQGGESGPQKMRKVATHVGNSGLVGAERLKGSP